MALNRQHPFVSPLGCAAGLVLFAGVGLAVWLTGGMAFSPGPLTALAERGTPLGGFKSHAEFEDDCGQCHAPLRGAAAARCENCHTDVRGERAARTGLHGGFKNADVSRCGACHPDHRGRNFNPSDVALARFDHWATGFSLARHQKDYSSTPLECRACHAAAGLAFDGASCAACHGAHDAAFMAEHIQTFGNKCLTCHDGTGSLANFDHSQVFPLDGAHASLDCAACHVNKQFKGTPAECAGCHAEPPIHAGVFGTDCASCHSTTAWQPAALKSHTFPLDHGGRGEIPCATCHPASYVEYTCYGCHEHDLAKTESKHAEEGITGSRLLDCAACHPTGSEEGGD